MHFGDDPRRVALGLDEPDTHDHDSDGGSDEPAGPEPKHSS